MASKLLWLLLLLIEDPTGLGGRLLTYARASGATARKPPPGPDERGRNQPRQHLTSKIASEMPIPHSLGKSFSTLRNVEVVKQYKDLDTFRTVSVI